MAPMGAEKGEFGSTTLTLRELDPALITRTRLNLSVGPLPTRNLGLVLADFARVGGGGQSGVHHLLTEPRRPLADPGTRSITSITRWKRSRSLRRVISNGVVTVPSSL